MQDPSSLQPGTITGMCASRHWLTARLWSPFLLGVLGGRPGAGPGGRLWGSRLLLRSHSCSPQPSHPVSWGENLTLSWPWGSLRGGSSSVCAEPWLLLVLMALLVCAGSWEGIPGRSRSGVPGRAGGSLGWVSHRVVMTCCPLSPPTAESHPGAQPLHGDDGGQPEEAPRRRHPGQPQRGHCTQQQRGDQDHLLGERGHASPQSFPPSVPPSLPSLAGADGAWQSPARAANAEVRRFVQSVILRVLRLSWVCLGKELKLGFLGFSAPKHKGDMTEILALRVF